MKFLTLTAGVSALILLPIFVRGEAVPASSVQTKSAPAAVPIGPRIDAIFKRWDQPHTPGLIIGVATEGVTVYTRGYGMANLEHAVKMSPQTVSESGSVAKQFTASAIALLAVRGKLSLDDPIQKYLPELPAFSAPITIRMLLNHTSGLRDIHGLFGLTGYPSYSAPHRNAEVLELIGHQRELNFAPGSEYLYSNTGFILLTFVVERVSGQPFAAFCADQIFKPRGLQNTTWRTDFTHLVPRRATAYRPLSNGAFVIDSPYSDIYGNGGVLSTIGDWLNWNASFDAPTGEWQRVTKLLQTPSKLNDGTTLNYGLGLGVTQYRGINEISHGGSTAGYRTFLARYPDRHVSIALMGNSADLNAAELVHRIADIIFSLPPVPEPVAVALAAADASLYAGSFYDQSHDELIKFHLQGGKIYHGQTALIPTAPHTFTSRTGVPVYTFNVSPSGKTINVTVGPEKPLRVFPTATLVTPGPAQLEDCVGDYHSDELDVTIPVRVTGGNLTFRIRPLPAFKSEATVADAFETPAGSFTFARGTDGTVSGFAFTSNDGRCRRVKFEKK